MGQTKTPLPDIKTSKIKADTSSVSGKDSTNKNNTDHNTNTNTTATKSARNANASSRPRSENGSMRLETARTRKNREAEEKENQDRVCNIYSWGWGEDGRLGLGRFKDEERGEKTHHTPHPIMSLHWRKDEGNKVFRAASGGMHTLYLLKSGKVLSSGWNRHGQLGQGNGADMVFDPADLLQPGDIGYKKIKYSKEELIFRAKEREKCWYPKPIVKLHENDVDEDQPQIIDVAASEKASFFLTKYGDIYSTGHGRFGVTGFPDEINRYKPTLVKSCYKINVEKISCGSWHVIILEKNTPKVAYAWGNNEYGQVGIKDGKCRCVYGPKKLLFGPKVSPRDISAGNQHSIALVEVERPDLKKDTAVYTWGNPANGRLGDVDLRSHFIPQENRVITKLFKKWKSKILKVVAGGNHNMILDRQGNLYTWGEAGYGALGYGHVWDRSDPAFVQGLKSVEDIYAGMRTSFAVVKGENDQQQVFGWGFNQFGELGVGDTSIRILPTFLYAFKRSNVTSIIPGWRHTLCITDGQALPVRYEEEYKLYFETLEKNGSLVYDTLKQTMKKRQLKPDLLDNPLAYLPTQVGNFDEDVFIDDIIPDLRYCLDTKKPMDPWLRGSWETRFRCTIHKLEFVCISCARTCHPKCYLECLFRPRSYDVKCDCMARRSCKCCWSQMRDIFDMYASKRTKCIKRSQLQEVLDRIRGDKIFTIEDLETAYEALCPDSLSSDDEDDIFNDAKVHIPPDVDIEWFSFQDWYIEYFSNRDMVYEAEQGAKEDEDDDD